MDGDVTSARPAASRICRILGFTALVALIAIAAFFLGWTLRPTRVTATALFEVGRETSAAFGETAKLDEQEFEIVKKTQIAKLKSNYVLTAAIRNPKVGGLPIIQEHENPVSWLQENLDITFPENGEILSISLEGAESQTQELVQIVDAVAKAYTNEVVNAERQRRLANRDLMSRTLDNLHQDIKRKMDEYLDIARDSGRMGDGSAEVSQQLDMKRLDRIEAEVMRLENDLAINPSGDAAKNKSIEERISQLNKKQAELEQRLITRAARSADLETREHELEQLQRIADEMTMRLERLDYDASSPDRIKMMQPAVISQN